MIERIDFALEPGVVIFAIIMFVLVNVLLAAVLYPYFRNSSSVGEGAQMEEATQDLVSEGPSRDEPLDERVDQFLEEIHSGKRG